MIIEHNPDEELNNESSPSFGPIDTDPDTDHKPEALQKSDLMTVVPAISKRVDELEQAVRILPTVEEDGSSECPFARELYAKKEELEQQVTSDIDVLNDFLVKLDKEIERCGKNLAQIQADSAKLNLQEPQDCYVQAELEQQKEYKDAVKDREDVYAVLVKAEAILKITQRKKYPGEEPQGQDQSPISFPDHVQIPPSESQPDTLGGEVDGLISLGPL